MIRDLPLKKPEARVTSKVLLNPILVDFRGHHILNLILLIALIPTKMFNWEKELLWDILERSHRKRCFMELWAVLLRMQRCSTLRGIFLPVFQWRFSASLPKKFPQTIPLGVPFRQQLQISPEGISRTHLCSHQVALGRFL